MSEQVNEQELVQFIAERTNVDTNRITLVLNHEQTFLNSAKEDAKGEVEIDSDELVDYILSRHDVKLDEITVETILDVEMDYLMEKGLAGYVD
jgi:predicted acetyltransferase